MPKLRRHARHRREEYTAGHRFHLATGHDFFGDGFRGVRETGRNFQERDWLTAEVLGDMRQCWELHKAEIIAREAVRFPGKPLWAQLVFEDGLSPEDARRVRFEHGRDHQEDLTW